MKSGGKDRYAGAVLMAMGVLVGIGGATLQVSSIARYGARMMPLIVASALLVLGLRIFLRGAKQGKGENGPADGAAGPEAARPAGSSLPVTLTFVLLAAYVLAISPIGFPVATFFYVLAQTFILSNFDKKKMFQAFFVALIGTASIYHIFTKYFHILLPSGILG